MISTRSARSRATFSFFHITAKASSCGRGGRGEGQLQGLMDGGWGVKDAPRGQGGPRAAICFPQSTGSCGTCCHLLLRGAQAVVARAAICFSEEHRQLWRTHHVGRAAAQRRVERGAPDCSQPRARGRGGREGRWSGPRRLSQQQLRRRRLDLPLAPAPAPICFSTSCPPTPSLPAAHGPRRPPPTPPGPQVLMGLLLPYSASLLNLHTTGH